LQEVILARAANLHVNDRRITFPEKTIKQLQKKLNWLRLVPSVNLPRWANLLERDSSIVSCLRTSLDSAASDPRDKVFAIAGLLKPHIRAMITIDYMLPVEDVFTQAVIVCIVERGDLELLRYAELLAADDLIARAFSMSHLQRFLVNTKKNANPVVGDTIVRSHGYIPAGQLLPRLEVRACFLDTCTKSSNSTADELVATVKTCASDLTQPIGLNPVRAVCTIFGFSPDAFVIEKNGGELAMDIKDLRQRSSSQKWTNFSTRYSLGFTSGHCLAEDVVTSIDGLSRPCLMRRIGKDCYRIVGTCYL
jgi:hypothetical protein